MDPQLLYLFLFVSDSYPRSTCFSSLFPSFSRKDFDDTFFIALSCLPPFCLLSIGFCTDLVRFVMFLRLDCALMFYLLEEAPFLGLSCRDFCMFSTGDLERECLAVQSLLTEVLDLPHSIKSCRNRGFYNFLRSYSGRIR